MEVNHIEEEIEIGLVVNLNKTGLCYNRRKLYTGGLRRGAQSVVRNEVTR